MTASVMPIYPTSGPARPLAGLYLEQRLYAHAAADAACVYGSFVCSLDGRIALDSALTPSGNPLEGLTSASDFRLFKELHAQADCLITNAGYLRELARGRLGNMLQVGPEFAAWRSQHGLPAQPAIVVASASMDFPLHASIAEHGQALYVAAGRAAADDRVRALRESGVQTIEAGDGRMVEGAPLVRALAQRGYRSLYLLAGPKMLEAMLRDRQLSRLFLTITHRLLGGERFHTLIEGPLLGEAGQLSMRSLYYDPGEAGGVGQWFAQFDCLQQQA